MHGSIDPGPDLVRHELHGAPGERRIGPVVARVEQRAERADLVQEPLEGAYEVSEALRVRVDRHLLPGFSSLNRKKMSHVVLPMLGYLSNGPALSGGPHAALGHDDPVAGPSAPTRC